MTEELKPGRELDALVAEKVMGLKINWDETTPCPLCGDVGRFCGARMWCSHDGWYYSQYKNYSTDIAAAWEVVEKLPFSGRPYIHLGLCDTYTDSPRWFVEVDLDGPFKRVLVKADTAPHAICLAALKAVEGK